MSQRSYKRKLAKAYKWAIAHVQAKASIQALLMSEREHCPICRTGRLRKGYQMGKPLLEFQMECRKCGRTFDLTPPPLPVELKQTVTGTEL